MVWCFMVITLYNPYKLPYNPSFHFMFHCLFHMIFHHWGNIPIYTGSGRSSSGCFAGYPGQSSPR